MNLWHILANQFPVSALPAQPETSALCPRSIEEVQEILQLVSSRREQIGICGSGSKLHWRSMPPILISTQNLNPTIDHAGEDLTVTVSAGITYRELQSFLEPSGQFLAIDPPYPDHCTIGGIIATGITGSLRHRYGGVRDMVLGIEFIRSDGIRAKAGGKVVKNVAGYDLMKLLTGAWGSLAIITAVTLRLYPLPQHRECWLVRGVPSHLGNLLTQLWRSGLTPTTVDLFSCGADRGELLIQFTGIAVGVTAQGEQLYHLAKNLSIAKVPQPTHPPIYHQCPELLLCKIGILPNYAPELMTRFAEYPMQIYAGSGIGMARIAQASLADLREFCTQRQGYVQILYPPPQSDRSGTERQHQLIAERIKQQFDRSGIFSHL